MHSLLHSSELLELKEVRNLCFSCGRQTFVWDLQLVKKFVFFSLLKSIKLRGLQIVLLENSIVFGSGRAPFLFGFSVISERARKKKQNVYNFDTLLIKAQTPFEGIHTSFLEETFECRPSPTLSLLKTVKPRNHQTPVCYRRVPLQVIKNEVDQILLYNGSNSKRVHL